MYEVFSRRQCARLHILIKWECTKLNVCISFTFNKQTTKYETKVKRMLGGYVNAYMDVKYR